MTEFISVINTIAYVLANLMVIYISIGVLAFTAGYYVLFDPRATTAGKLIFRFFLSLTGLILLVFVGTFIDPSGENTWLTLPTGIEPWRPVLRLAVYTYIAYTITSLAVLLWLRKYRPNRIKAAPDIGLVKVRHDTVDIPVVKRTSDD